MKCLPAEWNYVNTIDYKSGLNQIVIKYNPKDSSAPCNDNKSDFNKMNLKEVMCQKILSNTVKNEEIVE